MKSNKQNKKEKVIQLTKEDIQKVIADKAYNTPIGKELLYRLYSLMVGVHGKKEITPSDLEMMVPYTKLIGYFDIEALTQKWANFYHYHIERTNDEEKYLTSKLEKISFVGWADGWNLIDIFSKKKIQCLKKYYVGVRRFLDSDMEYLYDKQSNVFVPRYKIDIKNIMNKKFNLISKNLQKVFNGKKIPLEKLTDYEIKLLKTALWLDRSPCPSWRERQFEYIENTYKELQPEIAFGCMPARFPVLNNVNKGDML
jgi:hypothetical protein